MYKILIVFKTSGKQFGYDDRVNTIIKKIITYFGMKYSDHSLEYPIVTVTCEVTSDDILELNQLGAEDVELILFKYNNENDIQVVTIPSI